MLLVHHHQPQPRHGREHREARAEDDLRVAARGIEPGMGARGVLESAVQHRDPGFGKCLAETRFQLGREADFGHEHQRLSAAFDHLRDQLQVNLGLAAAGDAVQQKRPERAERGPDPADGLRLRRVWLVFRHEPVCLAARGNAGGFLAFRQGLDAAEPRRQRAGHGLAERPLVVRGQETHLLEPIRGKRRRVGEHARDRFQPRSRNRACAGDFDHDADPFARAERDRDAVAWPGRRRIVDQVIEKFRDRNVQRDA